MRQNLPHHTRRQRLKRHLAAELATRAYFMRRRSALAFGHDDMTEGSADQGDAKWATSPFMLVTGAAAA